MAPETTESRVDSDVAVFVTGVARQGINALPIIFGVLMFFGLVVLLRSQQNALLSNSELDSQLDETGTLRPLSEVIEATRALKLITVIVNSRVRTEMRDEQWRGNASAVVEAPVSYVYVVDLSDLQPDKFRFGSLFDKYEVEIPEPTRLAVEVDGSHPVEEIVEVTGTRLRSRAGEYQLGLARKEIYAQAQRNVPPKETMDEVRAKTTEQVENLVRRFVGPDAEVQVRIVKQ